MKFYDFVEEPAGQVTFVEWCEEVPSLCGGDGLGFMLGFERGDFCVEFRGEKKIFGFLKIEMSKKKSQTE
jgi:hypothetical protein